jgi:hypothetical protein
MIGQYFSPSKKQSYQYNKVFFAAVDDDTHFLLDININAFYQGNLGKELQCIM